MYLECSFGLNVEEVFFSEFFFFIIYYSLLYTYIYMVLHEENPYSSYLRTRDAKQREAVYFADLSFENLFEILSNMLNW